MTTAIDTAMALNERQVNALTAINRNNQFYHKGKWSRRGKASFMDSTVQSLVRQKLVEIRQWENARAFGRMAVITTHGRNVCDHLTNERKSA